MASWRDLTAAVAAVILLTACVGGGDDEALAKDDGDWSSLSERPCPEDSVLTYEDFGGPFVLPWCAGCHSVDLPADGRQGAPLGVDFDTIDDIRRQADRIWARSADGNGTMLPVGGPREDERALLGEWLACGVPAGWD